MEDISRELEREIAQSKPSPYKKNRKKSFLIVDDFGEIKSTGHLKVFVYVFLVTGIICFCAAGGFYTLFTHKALENKRLKVELTELKEKVDSLVADKEILMARLVISGKKPGIADPITESAVSPVKMVKEKKVGIKDKPIEKIASSPAGGTDDKIEIDAKAEEIASLSENLELGENQTSAQTESNVGSSIQKIVAIEKFAVTREGANGDLLVRFDIRNMSDKPEGVSGRIFTILKPENRPQEDWLVVPVAPLKDGVPSQHKRGQYFSIAHFKPVKFRIENQKGPKFYKKASIYIFNEEGELMFESLIDITEEEAEL